MVHIIICYFYFYFAVAFAVDFSFILSVSQIRSHRWSCEGLSVLISFTYAILYYIYYIYNIAPRFFNTLLGVWICDETLFLVFHILRIGCKVGACDCVQFFSHIELDISLVRFSHSCDILVITRNKFHIYAQFCNILYIFQTAVFIYNIFSGT